MKYAALTVDMLYDVRDRAIDRKGNYLFAKDEVIAAVNGLLRQMQRMSNKYRSKATLEKERKDLGWAVHYDRMANVIDGQISLVKKWFPVAQKEAR